MTVDEHHDRRIRRTQMAIFNAFRGLVLSRRYDDIRVADIITAADVGRSTFYEHFNSKDDVLLSSIEPLFAILADIPAGQARRDRVQFLAGHFWEQRAFARVIFNGDIYERLTRKLTDMIEVRLEKELAAQRRLSAVAHASSLLGVLRAWIAGDFTMSAEELTAQLLTGGAATPPRQ